MQYRLKFNRHAAHVNRTAIWAWLDKLTVEQHNAAGATTFDEQGYSRFCRRVDVENVLADWIAANGGERHWYLFLTFGYES